MLHDNTLHEIRTSNLPCIEYEIGMFLCLLSNQNEVEAVLEAASARDDFDKIQNIVNVTNKEAILNILSYAGMRFDDVSFETQNDDVGPADIVIYSTNRHHEQKRIGVSVKYDNDCIYNYTGRELLTEEQITRLQSLIPVYANLYLEEMIGRFGSFEEWYQARIDRTNPRRNLLRDSDSTNQFIDLVRDEVLNHWALMSQEEKDTFLYNVYRTDSPLDYWIYSFQKRDKFILCTNPPYIRRSSYPRVTIRKIASQSIGFYLDNQLLGKTQVKFNDGILEKYQTVTLTNAMQTNDEARVDDILHRFVERGIGLVRNGIPLKFGKPFTSWNFTISY